MRRRKTAMLFTLVLVLELALLLCACGHLCAHDCPRGETCTICQCARDGLRAAFLPVFLLFSFALNIHHLLGQSAASRAVGLSSPVSEKVRMND